MEFLVPNRLLLATLFLLRKCIYTIFFKRTTKWEENIRSNLSNQTEDFTIQAMEVDKDHIHLLVDYSPNVSVAQIVRLLKQMTTSAVWFSHSAELRKHFWKQKVFWSSGYFVCSTGDASTETIAKYIAEQG